MARIRGGDVAAIGSVPEARPDGDVEHLRRGRGAPTTSAEKVRAAGGVVFMDPFDVMDAGRMAVVADPEGAVFCLWEAKENFGARRRQRARRAELQRPRTRDAAAEAFYGAVFGWKILSLPPAHVDAPGLRRSPRGESTGSARADGADGRAGRLHRRRRGDEPDRRRRHRHPGALVGHLRRRRHGRDRRLATELGGRSSPDRSTRRGRGSPCSRTHRARRSSPASSWPRTRWPRTELSAQVLARGSRSCAPTPSRRHSRRTSRARPSC